MANNALAIPNKMFNNTDINRIANNHPKGNVIGSNNMNDVARNENNKNKTNFGNNDFGEYNTFFFTNFSVVHE